MASLSNTRDIAPHSDDSEQAVLGSILTAPECLEEVQPIITSPDMFFTLRNGWIYEAFLALQDRGEAIDYLTVVEELRFKKQDGKSRLDLIGGPSYLTGLTINTPTHIHARTYATAVRRYWRRRNLLDAATTIARTAMSETLTEQEIVSQADTVYYAAVESAVPNDTISMTSIMSEIYDEVLYKMEHPDECCDIATGFKQLDSVLGGGLQPGDLVIVAARPGMGKTSFALCSALKQAEFNRKRVGFFTLEMKPKQLGYRAAAIEAGINSKKFRSGRLNEHEVSEFTRAVGKLSELGLYFDGKQNGTIKEVAPKVRKMCREFGIDILYVDYLQLMLQGDPKFATLEIGQITRMFKLLAIELNIPVVLLSQLNRDVEKRADKRPMLSDLRQSGAIEQDADTVIFIYRDEVYHENTERPGQADLIVAKQRNGETTSATLGYESYTTKFFEAEIAKVYIND